MGKKSDPPPGPDWDRLLDMAEDFAEQNREIFDEYMAFQDQAYADQKATADAILDVQLPAMQAEADFAQTMRDRYMEMGIPFEDEYLDQITNWDTTERRDERAGEAQAQIADATEAAREAELRRLEGYGIDPSQTRSAALDSRIRLEDAVARAAAGNAQRRAVESEGLQLGGQAVDMMRGYPAASTQALANATGAGAAGLGAQQGADATMSSAYPTGSNILAQGWNATQGAYGTAGNLYQNDLKAWEMERANSPIAALGNLAGTALGAAGAAGGFGPLMGFAEGGPGDKAMAHPRPPSQGIPTDNVPAMLNPNEFVIPDDVARWEGEKNLQKMINKAREDRSKTEMQRAQNQQAMGIPA